MRGTSAIISLVTAVISVQFGMPAHAAPQCYTDASDAYIDSLNKQVRTHQRPAGISPQCASTNASPTTTKAALSQESQPSSMVRRTPLLTHHRPCDRCSTRGQYLRTYPQHDVAPDIRPRLTVSLR
jgi:hypothetical protein